MTRQICFQRGLALELPLWLLACGDSAKTGKMLRVGFVPAEDAQQVMQNAQEPFSH